MRTLPIELREQAITRRQFLKTTGFTTGLVVSGLGLEGIIASKQAPVYAQERAIHFLLWKNFSPPADREIIRQGEEWGKANRVKVRIEQINANDIPGRASAAVESQTGPDIIQFFHNWQVQYADSLVDVTDICVDLESKYGGYLDYAKEHAMYKGRFTAVPHTIVPNIYVARKSYLKEAGTEAWPATWDDLRREGRKWKERGHPIGQTVGHTFGDAVNFTYSYFASYGSKERHPDGRVAFNSKETLEALKAFKPMWDDAFDPAGPGWDDSNNNRAFLSGAIAATQNAPSIYLKASNELLLDTKGEPLVLDIAHYPDPAGPAGVFHYHYTQQLGIMKYSKNIDICREFLIWLLDKEQYARYLRRGQAYQSSPLRAYLEDPMWEMFPALKPYRDWLPKGLRVGLDGPADEKAARVVQNYVLIDVLANVATGKMSPEEAMLWGEKRLKEFYEA
ncbi:MAG: extracellular solute-binding protein [Nitrospinota bacterium]|nr:MAG: extracellular solute-binding protein [Nitrospinota bacterium]